MTLRKFLEVGVPDYIRSQYQFDFAPWNCVMIYHCESSL